MEVGQGAALEALRRPASFSVAYLNAPSLSGAFWRAWQAVLVIALVLGGGPVWVWKVRCGCSPLAAPALPSHTTRLNQQRQQQTTTNNNNN